MLEGVLMRGKKAYAMAIRRPDGVIEMREKQIPPISEWMKFFRLPLVRGFVALCSSMALGFSAISQSAEIAMEGIEYDSTPNSFDIFLNNRFGDKLNDIIMTVAMVFAVIIAIVLFMILPAVLVAFLPIATAFSGAVEGVLRLLIFLLYVFFLSRSKDIQRVFQYHGAEHKVINCHEKNLPLTTTNVAACDRLHRRCGTSFMLVVMTITMILFMIIRIDGMMLRVASRVLLLPIIAGISYEISVKWAATHDNLLVKAIIAPGMLMQRLTTKEPDESQIEVAVMALTRAVEQDNVY